MVANQDAAPAGALQGDERRRDDALARLVHDNQAVLLAQQFFAGADGGHNDDVEMRGALLLELDLS